LSREFCKPNLITQSDSYKISQYRQYPPGTTKVYSNFLSRGGKWLESVFFGLQYIMDTYLEGEGRVNASDVANAKALYKLHFGQDIFNEAGWRHIVDDHSGRLPISIKAVPEGTVVPIHNVLMTVENTCPRCYWLTNYLETLLVQIWYPITVATQSREIKRIILGYLKKNGDPNGLSFKLHDFGFRGVSSVESAGIGGAAHLVNFLGTDTVRGIEIIAKHYGLDCSGFSIPASEHSTITSWGRDREVEAFRNILDQYPTGYVACVSDSYDIFKACSELWGGELREKVLARDGCLVVRPDSGDPAKVIMKVLPLLGNAFGITYNSKKYKVLNPKVRVIQGDGVNIDSITEILRQMDQMDWSADNIAFGMGGALLQKLDRDTLRMAFKCSYVEGVSPNPAHANCTYEHCGGHPEEVRWSRDVYKEPITDPGKNSPRGKLALVKRDGAFCTVPQSLANGEDHLVEVFRDGKILQRYDFQSIRERAVC
jgi:nicotinamide phosphoribosyltransferase